MSTKTFLKKIPLFSQLPLEGIDALLKQGQNLSFEAGQVVCWEGEESDGMYVILKGEVKVYKTDEEGNQININTLKRSDFFGEMALLDSEPRSATVACSTPCRLFMLDREAFMTLLLNPQVRLTAFSALVKRIRVLTEKYVDEEIAQRTLQAEMEAERHHSLAQMVAGIAHELNTPLGIVNTAVDMIQKRVQNDALTIPLADNRRAQTVLEEMNEAAILASRNISRAHKLVEKFKKISVNQLTDLREKVDLPTLVQDILELFKLNARQSKLKIEVNNKLPDDQKSWSGYPGQLTQVLTNLLFNIERYAYPDQTGGLIKIGLYADNQHHPIRFVLSIQDFGQGIPPEHLPQLFAPFFTTGRGQGGTGLGLAIVHNIITDVFKGSISVESELDKGTKFVISFPQITP